MWHLFDGSGEGELGVLNLSRVELSHFGEWVVVVARQLATSPQTGKQGSAVHYPHLNTDDLLKPLNLRRQR